MIDGNSFAHRSYHALPKTIRRRDGKSAGAILGFANFLLRLYADERPRAVIVGWDSLEAPTKRHEMFPAAGGKAIDAQARSSRTRERGDFGPFVGEVDAENVSCAPQGSAAG